MSFETKAQNEAIKIIEDAFEEYINERTQLIKTYLHPDGLGFKEHNPPQVNGRTFEYWYVSRWLDKQAEKFKTLGVTIMFLKEMLK